MRSLSIFLTGSSGFIGRNIFEQLGKKYIFYAPSSKELDITDFFSVESFMKNHKIDVVVHTAKVGGTRKNPNSAEIAEVNSRMFFNITRNEKYFNKMIFLGSGAEYDVSRSLKKVKEEQFDEVVPRDSYGFYKYVCSKYIGNSSKIVNLRLFGIYGKYEDYELRFISNAICKNILGLPITMRQNVFFDYVYIHDFVKIVDYFINNDCRYKFYNIGRGEKIDFLTIARIINKISSKRSKIVVKKPGLKNEYTCDNYRLMHEITYLRFTDFEKTVKELYAWYKSINSSLSIKSFLVDK